MQTKSEVSSRDAAYYHAHRDEILVRKAAYYAGHREEKRAYHAAYRADHKEEKRAQRIAYDAAHREERRERAAMQQRWFLGDLRILRAAQGCDGCGVHEGRLEHHHVDPATKRYNISDMYSRSFERFLDEVAKCAVMCLPCHRKRHVELRLSESATVC